MSSQITTPFPLAKPLALTPKDKNEFEHILCQNIRIKISALAVLMPFSHKFFRKALLPSKSAARLVGPKFKKIMF
jgi:hypothetical protein